MILIRSFSVIAGLSLMAFLVALITRSMKEFAAPLGMPRPLASIFSSLLILSSLNSVSMLCPKLN